MNKNNVIGIFGLLSACLLSWFAVEYLAPSNKPTAAVLDPQRLHSQIPAKNVYFEAYKDTLRQYTDTVCKYDRIRQNAKSNVAEAAAQYTLIKYKLLIHKLR